MSYALLVTVQGAPNVFSVHVELQPGEDWEQRARRIISEGFIDRGTNTIYGPVAVYSVQRVEGRNPEDYTDEPPRRARLGRRVAGRDDL